MHILVAPDDFKGTLSAAAAADAIIAGWLRSAPAANMTARPLSDGGPGFVSAIARARQAVVVRSEVMGPLGVPVTAEWCICDGVAYLEAAQVVGLQFGRDVMRATSVGLGELLRVATQRGARRVVFGLGGTNVNDGGAGLLSALGAIGTDTTGEPIRLDLGPRALKPVMQVDLTAALAAVAGVELVAATDVDVPLLGPRGATYGFATQKGAIDTDLVELETTLQRFSDACGRRADGKDAAVALGAGAAGGLGFALLRLGARRQPGIDTVWHESSIDLDGVDLIVTGEGTLDWQSQRGKVLSGVARRGVDRGIPVIALCGRVEMAKRERMELGLAAAYDMAEFAGEESAMGLPEQTLSDLAERVARTWR